MTEHTKEREELVTLILNTCNVSLVDTLKRDAVLELVLLFEQKRIAELEEQLMTCRVGLSNRDVIYKKVTDDYAELERQNAELREKYSDLIMQVARHSTNETRHETAKRYIKNAESDSGRCESSEKLIKVL